MPFRGYFEVPFRSHSNKRKMDKIPNSVIDQLKRCAGVIIRNEERLLLDLSLSVDGQDVFKSYLRSCNTDPRVYPLFGPPLAPFVPATVQIEVHCVLATFHNLRADQLIAPPFPPLVAHPLGSFYFFHQSSLLHAIEEIIAQRKYSNDLPFLRELPGGQKICDLDILYRNCAVLLPVRKE